MGIISSGNWVFHQHRDFPGEALQMSVSYRSYRAGRRNMPPSVEPLGCVACWKTSICPPKKSHLQKKHHIRKSVFWGWDMLSFFKENINELFLEAQRWTFWIEEPFFEKAWEPNIRGIRCEATQFWAINVIRPYLNSDQYPLKWTQLYIGIHRLY